MEARNRSLGEWFSRIKSGQVQLPRFQRFEAWGTREVADLLETVIDELPAGAALVLEVGDEAPFHHRPLVGAPSPAERMNELLLDGQQRLTALWRSLNDDYPDRQFYVDVSTLGEVEDSQQIVPQARWDRDGQRYPVWCDDPRQVLERGYLPLHLLRPGNEGEEECHAWLREATDGDVNRLLDLQPDANSLRSRFAFFNLPFLALPVGSSAAVVLNVFEKLNTRAIPLTAFDIVVARVEGETSESLHDLVASLDGQVPRLKHYIQPSSLILPAAALLQGKRPTRRELIFLDYQRMVGDWSTMVRGAELLVQFLEEERIFDGVRLPSEVVLAPLLVLWAAAPDQPDKLGTVRTLLRSFMWRAFLTARYEAAAATATQQDFGRLLPAVREGASTADAPIFDADLPNVEQLMSAGWPRTRERLARALLCMTLRGGALDIADGAAASAANLEQREYHHLFPVAFLAERGIPEWRASRALNCALVTWRTNRTISAKPPVDYLRERCEAAALGEDEVRQRLASHFVDYDQLAAGDLDDFLTGRAEALTEGIERLAAGVVWP